MKLLRRFLSSSTSNAPLKSASLTTEEIAKFSAFANRSGIILKNPDNLIAALTHSSYLDTADTQHERLQFLGNSVLSFFTTEFIFAKYPEMPADVVSSLVNAYIGRRALASVGESFGVQHVMRWKLNEKDPKSIAAKPFVISKVTRALIGAMYQDKGPLTTRAFINAHFFSRSLDAVDHLHHIVKHPRHLLLKVSEKLGKRRPVARLLKETGRKSQHSVFVVGIFMGSEKVSEGYGDSLSMAEVRATKRALEDHYLHELKDIQLQSDFLNEEVTFFEEEIKNKEK